MKVFFGIFFVIFGVFATTSVSSQQSTGLPFELDYFMTKAQVLTHLKAFQAYRTESGHPDTIAYVIRDPATNSSNGVFLEFVNDKLLEISSMKTNLDKDLFDKYMTEMLAMAQQWKSKGVRAIMEEKSHNFYIYRDDRSYITIGGNSSINNTKSYVVTISFIEQQTRDDKILPRK